MRTKYKTFQNNQPYFITMTVVNWVSIFTTRTMFNIIIDSLQFLKSSSGLKIFAFVILDNHIHIIASSEDLSAIIRRHKSHTVRVLIDNLVKGNRFYLLKQLEFGKKVYKKDQKYQVWQDGFQPKLIQSNEIMMQKIEYIHNNPVKRGYVEKPAFWIYSSAKNYLTPKKSVLEVELFEP